MWDKFLEAVGHHFSFLEADFGFDRKAPKPPFVTYESVKLEILVYFGGDRDGEIDLRIRRIGRDHSASLSVGIGMLIDLRNGPESHAPAFPSTEEALEAEVKRLAQLLRKYGSTLLEGDLSDFDRIEEMERELAKKFGPQT